MDDETSIPPPAAGPGFPGLAQTRRRLGIQSNNLPLEALLLWFFDLINRPWTLDRFPGFPPKG